MQNFQKTIIKRIKLVREELGFSAAELSKRMSVSDTIIHKLENGLAGNPEKYLEKLSDATGKSIAYFIGEDTPELTKYAEKARILDSLADVLRENGLVMNDDSTTQSGDNSANLSNVTVGGDVNVGVEQKIVDKLAHKNEKELDIVSQVLDMNQEDTSKLFKLMEMLKNNNS